MRNLLLFLIKFHTFFLFLLLELLSTVLIVRNNTFQRASFINSTNVVAGSAYKYISTITDYLSLKSVNDQLATENADFRAREKSSFYNSQGQLERVNNLLYRQMYTYIPAKVLNNQRAQTVVPFPHVGRT